MWNVNTEYDMDRYYIYRGGIKIAETINRFYTDNNLQTDVVYEYAISAVDIYGNEGEKSDIKKVMISDDSYLYVDMIEIDTITLLIFFEAFLIYVTIKDQTGMVVRDGQVTILLRLNTGRRLYFKATTSVFGKADFKYWNLRLIQRGYYTITVTNLEKAGYYYESRMNKETSERIYIS